MGHDIDGETAANGARWIQVYDEPQLEEECDAAESDTMRRRMYEEEQEEEVCNAARERDAAEREAAMLQSVAEDDDAADALIATWDSLIERTEQHLEAVEAARAWGDFECSIAASQFFAAGAWRRSYLAGIVAWFKGK